ncbi:hypothetical protein Syun_001039 [Stephania yunnanensis]|uniref:Uncharacterized protein n=1 Tax=Stephania yunnanensis TaxID=152371 RepID=A0AAP0LH29_9MAGN
MTSSESCIIIIRHWINPLGHITHNGIIEGETHQKTSRKRIVERAVEEMCPCLEMCTVLRITKFPPVVVPNWPAHGLSQCWPNPPSHRHVHQGQTQVSIVECWNADGSDRHATLVFDDIRHGTNIGLDCEFVDLGDGADAHIEEELMEAEVSELLLVCDVLQTLMLRLLIGGENGDRRHEALPLPINLYSTSLAPSLTSWLSRDNSRMWWDENSKLVEKFAKIQICHRGCTIGTRYGTFGGRGKLRAVDNDEEERISVDTWEYMKVVERASKASLSISSWLVANPIPKWSKIASQSELSRRILIPVPQRSTQRHHSAHNSKKSIMGTKVDIIAPASVPTAEKSNINCRVIFIELADRKRPQRPKKCEKDPSLGEYQGKDGTMERNLKGINTSQGMGTEVGTVAPGLVPTAEKMHKE